MHERHPGRRDEDYRSPRGRYAHREDHRRRSDEERRDYDQDWDRHGRAGHDIYVNDRDGDGHAENVREDDHRRRWPDRAADGVKAMFGSERAERRLRQDRAHEVYDDRHDQHGRHDYRGVGPRARHDEDDELREMISQALEDDPDLDASDILVRVVDNEAILDGTVRRKRDAERAYRLAHETPGIVHVRERLHIGRDRDDRVRRATIGMGYQEGPSRRRWRT